MGRSVLALSVFLLVNSWNVLAQKNYIINTIARAPLSTAERNGYIDLLILNAFHRLGLDVKFRTLPAERSLLNLNQGFDDGTAVRIIGLEKYYKNLIRVPESIFDMEFIAISKHHSLQIESWQDLSDYNIAYINGWKLVEKNIQHAKSITKVSDVDQLFTLLDKERTDVIIYSRWPGTYYIRQHSLDDLVINESALTTQPMYLYLHKRHQAIASMIAQELRQMKISGVFNQIANEALFPLVQITEVLSDD